MTGNNNKLNNALERYGDNEHESQQQVQLTLGGRIFCIIILLLVIIGAFCFIYAISSDSSSSSSSTVTSSKTHSYSNSNTDDYHICNYCHKSEKCDRYFMVLNDDVSIDSNGDVKMSGNYVWLSSECYKEMWHNYSYEVFSIEKRW